MSPVELYRAEKQRHVERFEALCVELRQQHGTAIEAPKWERTRKYSSAEYYQKTKARRLAQQQIRRGNKPKAVPASDPRWDMHRENLAKARAKRQELVRAKRGAS